MHTMDLEPGIINSGEQLREPIVLRECLVLPLILSSTEVGNELQELSSCALDVFNVKQGCS